VPYKNMIAAEGKIRIRGPVLHGRRPRRTRGRRGFRRRSGRWEGIAGRKARRLRQSGEPFHAECCFAGVGQSSLKSNTWIVGWRTWIRRDRLFGGRSGAILREQRERDS